MGRVRVTLALAAGALLALLAAPVSAQGPPADKGKLDVTLATTAIVFPTPAIIDYDAGWVEQGGVTISIQSRPPTEAWELRVRAGTVTMGGAGKPITDILWRPDGSGVWTPLTTTDELVMQGTGDLDLTLYFRVRLDWALDTPADYGADLTFSATRP